MALAHSTIPNTVLSPSLLAAGEFDGRYSTIGTPVEPLSLKNDIRSHWSPRIIKTPSTQDLPTYSEQLLQKMATSLDELANQRHATEEQDTVEYEWMYLALLLDRILLVVFVLVILITSVVTLLMRAE